MVLGGEDVGNSGDLKVVLELVGEDGRLDADVDDLAWTETGILVGLKAVVGVWDALE